MYKPLTKEQLKKFIKIKEMYEEELILGRSLGEAIAYAQISHDPKQLMDLGKHSDWFVRYSAFKNPHMPFEILKKAGNTKDPYIKSGISKNTSTPFEIIKKLMHDPDKDIAANAEKTLMLKRIKRD